MTPDDAGLAILATMDDAELIAYARELVALLADTPRESPGNEPLLTEWGRACSELHSRSMDESVIYGD